MRNTLRKSIRTEKRFNAGMPWTNADVERLVGLYPKHSNRDLAATFGRAELGIMGKARSLGLKKNRINDYRRWVSVNASPWSIEEITLLEALFPTTPSEEMAEIIDRSANAIALKARKIGLRKMEFWSDQENEFLRSNYKQLSYGQLAEQLERSSGSVQVRVITLGLGCKVKNWTEQEIEFLKTSYPQQSFNEIAFQLRRTPAAVGQKAARIGLIQDHYWPKRELAILCELYSQCTLSEIAQKLGRKYDAVRYQVKKLGLFKHKYNVEEATNDKLCDITKVAS